MASARLWEDGTGRTRWQPVMEDGFAAYCGYGPGAIAWAEPPRHQQHPRMYRSRRRAIRVARQAERDFARSNWKPVD